MEPQEFMLFVEQLQKLTDNKAIALYQLRKDECTDIQRIMVLETFLIAVIGKVAKLEHVTGSKNM